MYPYDTWGTDIGSAVFDEGLERYSFGIEDIEILTGPYAGTYCTDELFNSLREKKDTSLVACHNATPAEDIRKVYSLPYCMFGSDSSLCVPETGKAMGHPRSSSAVVKFLCDYVSDGDLSLAEGLAKLTVLPARKLGLSTKGRLQTGMDADLVLFDPDSLKVNASFGPGVCAEPPDGIKCVIVAGKTL